MTSPGFVGRVPELQALDRQADVVRGGEARLLSVRGRRQVGKSRLISEFIRRLGWPQIFVTGSAQATLAGDLESFRQDASLSCTLPGGHLLGSTTFTTWESALGAVRLALPSDRPSVVVLDEVPWLLRRDAGLEGTLQKLWDRQFESAPVLMILIGSDLSVMEMLSTHGRPLYGRIREMVINPLNVRDTARLAQLDEVDNRSAATAFDATLLTGGYPRMVSDWARTPSFDTFLTDQLADDTSALVTAGQRILDAEFPADLQASEVLRAIGSGERTYTTIAQRSGVGSSALARSLKFLVEKRVVVADHPLSLRPTPKLARYRVADHYLRFWLRFIEPGVVDIQRGRPDLALERVRRDWSQYRGRAIEPLVRDALTRLAAADESLGGAEAVGGWWPRTNNPEVDLIGVTPASHPTRVSFVGSIKWRDDAPFDPADLAALAAHRAQVPGAELAALVAVSRSGCTATPDAFYDAAALLRAWP